MVRRLRGWMLVVGVVSVCVLATTCSAAGPPAATGRTYYLSPAGDDDADGRSPATAWRSLDRANAVAFRPGDALLLEGGARFTGTLVLDQRDGGDPAAPVVIGAYSAGGPVIEASHAPAVSISTSGVEIRDLTAVGEGSAYDRWAGILLVNDRTDGRLLEHVHVSRVDVSGFKRGIEVTASGPAGFHDVLVSESALHRNMEAGFASHGSDFVAGSPGYAHSGIVLRDVAAFGNVGDPHNTTRNTGSGAVLGSVRGGLVERSRFFDNGAASVASEGPLGVWAYDSTGVVIQQSMSYRNRTAATDGGGFGLDINVSDSVLQYNLSYDNDGPGYQLYTWEANDAHTGNTVRFNISRDDARRTIYGALTVLGRVNRSDVYQNTVVLTAATARERPPVVLIGPEVSAVSLRNNIVVTDGAGPLVSAAALPSSAVALQGNDYHAQAGGWLVRWGDTVHASLDSWRTATDQERIDGQPSGLSVDPRFVDFDASLDTAPAGSDLPAAASGLRLDPASPLVGAGLDLSALAGVEQGPMDYFGTPLADASPAVGAHRPALG
ncbi:right-handed parallel beta-helix repeat-containing protein [Pseudonocardia sp. H11422]|uniref:right-handed parallel beta-helix repeat-containing protein n=1 Tax=Pseudonocardia sp. H11422 TaxID=2835866 RepID=UPI001BDC5A79|nr:right-handed parallel beta-helix repeat-containing protein [Pseudonocardia sp. H11422]